MDKKIQNLLNKWLENNLISESTYENIVNFENNSNPSQKSKVAKTITLIGSLFLLSGLLVTLPLMWDNLAYWAQLLLLIVTTMFLIYAANYSEKFEDRNIGYFFYNGGNDSADTCLKIHQAAQILKFDLCAIAIPKTIDTVSYTHLRAHET